MIFIRTFLLLLIFFSSSSLLSQLRIEIRSGLEEPLRIAVVPIEWGIDSPPNHYVHEVIKKDLELFGEFKVIDPEVMLSLPVNLEEVFYRDWRLLDIDYLVIGSAKALGDLEVSLDYFIIDIVREKIIHKAIISGSLVSIKRIAHNVSDKIYEKISGLSGIFSTRIAYVDKPYKSVDRYDLRITDINGDNDLSLFSSEQPILSPAWSPSGQELAYVSFEEGTSRIYIQELATGTRRPLKREEGINSSPSWSPDGRYIAAVLSKGDNPDIYIYDLRRNSWKQLTSHYGIDTEPDWSESGNSLIFTSNRSGSPQIYEINIKSKRIKRKTFEGTYNARARYLSNGKKIIYIHRKKGVFHVALQDLRSGKIRILTDTLLDESPSVSPNGNVIIYATKDGDRDVLAGVTLNSQTKFMLPSASGGAREPSWSPKID